MSNSLWGFKTTSFLSHIQLKEPKGFAKTKKLHVMVSPRSGEGPLSQVTETKNGKKVKLQIPARPGHGGQYGQFDLSDYSMARDVVSLLKNDLFQFESIHLDVKKLSSESLRGFLVGLEMITYRYKTTFHGTLGKKKVWLELKDSKMSKTINHWIHEGRGVNLARHLVNLPANELNPKSYGASLKSLFQDTEAKVELWNSERLLKEKMHLHHAVGRAAEEGPCLVRVTYKGNKKSKKHYAFVGKGITFDSGGLDLKPASGMRWMKKDMGGSAAVVGLCHWVVQTKQPINATFYLAMAENAVSANSFRPGDVITGRAGVSVEIHNTDAEGRLVLCDALALAAESKPEFILDVATLTGAIKVGLGDQVPGLFSNKDDLANDLLKSAQHAGDTCWRMPLDPQQKGRLKSTVADLVNCTDGFGGAVTAALFLEHFVKEVPWAHLDIYAWTEARGAFAEKGGSGQAVQALVEFVKSVMLTQDDL